MARGRTGIRALVVQSGGPVATVVLASDGTVRPTWISDSMGELLGIGDGDDIPRFAELLSADSQARLSALVRDLVRLDGRSASVQVTRLVRGRPVLLRFHLLLNPPRALDRLLVAAGMARSRRAVLRAEPAGGEITARPAGGSPGRAELADRLGRALLRMHRSGARVAVAMVSVLVLGEDGPRPVPLPAMARLVDAVRGAARGTDTVIALGPGWLAVLAEEVAPGGEIVMAQRLLAMLNQHGRPDSVPAGGVAVMEIADSAANPDVVIDHLLRAEAPPGGLVILEPWDGAGPAGPAVEHDGDRTELRIRTALDSGRFVLGRRSLEPMGRRPGGTPYDDEPDLRARLHEPQWTVVEAVTVDDGVPALVQVDAPGLSRALDRWLLGQVAAMSAAGAPPRLAIRLQRGGPLTASLQDEAVDTLGGRAILVPERRLGEAIGAQRAVLRDLAARGVVLGVTGWSGQIDVQTLVRAGITLVEISPAVRRAASSPEGAALLTALVAGLRAGHGRRSVVFTEDPRDGEVRSALLACGVIWAIPARGLIMGRT